MRSGYELRKARRRARLRRGFHIPGYCCDVSLALAPTGHRNPNELYYELLRKREERRLAESGLGKI